MQQYKTVQSRSLLNNILQKIVITICSRKIYKDLFNLLIIF